MTSGLWQLTQCRVPERKRRIRVRACSGTSLRAVRHTFVWVRVHLVWSTSRRQAWIDRAWEEQLYRCLAGVARRKGAILLCAGGAPDHVHLYVSLASHTSLASLVDALKANSSRWIHDTFPHLRIFAWQKGYSAFSVCRRCERGVIRYIRNQEAHHGPARQGYGPARQGGVDGATRESGVDHGPARQGGVDGGRLARSRSLNLWIFPVAVFGSSSTNTIQRGYL